MIVLGIGGFESTGDRTARRPGGRVEELLQFSAGRIPLQFFPLDLIGHDSSAALLVDGELVACASEERFTRIKHGYNIIGETVLPRRAIEYCLGQAGVGWGDIDRIAHYCRFTEEAVESRLRRVSTALDPARRAVLRRAYTAAYRARLSSQVLLGQLEALARRGIPAQKLVQVRHHLAHAAGTFFSSGFDHALILTLDGYGEEESSIWAIGDGRRIHLEGAMHLPHSLGVLYQIITAYLGFSSFGDEYKVMGLSSYGDPSAFMPVFEQLVELLPNGTYSVQIALPGLFQWLRERLGEPGSGGLDRRSADIAAALQLRLQQAVMHQLSHLRARYPMKRLCLSGGVALNARLNRAILESGLFCEVFFQPAAADDGASLGAALWAHHAEGRSGCRPIEHVFWGPEYASAEIEECLRRSEAVVWTREERIEQTAARLLAGGKVIGWFQGRMEMGPRALGARSILADPRSAEVRDRINRMVKQREGFRPFAPSVLEDQAPDFFQLGSVRAAPYMLVTFETHRHTRALIPAVVHVDGSARIQTVSAKANPRFHGLLKRFYHQTGVPVLLNTSFNQAGEPIVNSPDDAVGCLLRSGLDALAVGDYLVLPRVERKRESECGSRSC